MERNLVYLFINKDGIVGKWYEWVTLIISCLMIAYYVFNGIDVGMIMTIPTGVLLGSYLYRLDYKVNGERE